MKSIIKDLFIIVVMMACEIGIAAFCLFAPPIPLWVSLPVILVMTAWLMREVYKCR